VATIWKKVVTDLEISSFVFLYPCVTTPRHLHIGCYIWRCNICYLCRGDWSRSWLWLRFFAIYGFPNYVLFWIVFYIFLIS